MGTGKTLVALQVANIIHESAKDSPQNKPLLVVTAFQRQKEIPLMKYFVASTQERPNVFCLA